MIDETQSHDTTPPTPDDNRWAAALKRPEPPAAKLRRRRQRSQEKTLYAVPRRFDIATMLVVSLAYSILFTGLRLLDAPWQVFAYFGLLTVVVGVAQRSFPTATNLAGRRSILGSAIAVCGALHSAC